MTDFRHISTGSDTSLRYRAVVFDFDGTLATLTLDFARMQQNVVATVATFFPHPPAPPGIPMLEWVEQLAQELLNSNASDGHAMAAALRNAANATSIREVEVEAAANGGLFPYTRPLLAALRNAGIGVGVITRNCAPALAVAFPDAADYVDVMLTRDDVTRVKPDPAHLGAALERMQCPPGAALMVGDHPMDIETGRLMGTHSAGVASGRINTETLADAGADYVATDCLALCKGLADQGLLPPLNGL